MSKQKRSPKLVAGLAVALAAAIAIPLAALAAAPDPDYSWYSPGSTSYTLEDEGDFIGFTNLVNGTADVEDIDIDGDGETDDAVTFEGATVNLGANLSFNNETLTPVGGGANGDAEFDGVFDGQGHSINNFTIETDTANSNIGLFGKTGSDSKIADVVLGANATLSLTRSSEDPLESENLMQTPVCNVGLLVGYAGGSVCGCTSSGTVTVNDDADQSLDMPFVVYNVGGLCGQVMGDLTSCSHAGGLTVTAEGKCVSVSSDDEEWFPAEESIVANVGGVVGCAGSLDSSFSTVEVDREVGENVHGVISGCTNSGIVAIDTPSKAGKDRFGNQLVATSECVGGIVGYSRGSIDGCANTGFLDCGNALSIGGIVGAVRSAFGGSNFSSEGTDDGILLDEAGAAEALTVTGCTNGVPSSESEYSKDGDVPYYEGTVYGRAFSGGIVGRGGTDVAITECINQETAMVYGTRVTKPFPAGIAGNSYGTVSYCANLGTVVSGTKADDYAATYTKGAGYYAAGLVGGMFYYMQYNEANKLTRVGDLPETYGCYNAGDIIATDNMRQRALIGDCEGYVHDNAALVDKVYNNRLCYGIYDGDDETSGATFARNTLVSETQLMGSTLLAQSQLDGEAIDADTLSEALEAVEGGEGMSTVFALLNSYAERDGWAVYWCKSNVSATDSVNGGFPVLDSQVTWTTAGIEDAAVSLAENAEYTGSEAVPKATVILTVDGQDVALEQGVDFRVIPQEDAIEVTGEGETPYTATVAGIGNYSGMASQAFNYGIDAGSLANCSVSIEGTKFNWEAQTPSDSDITVTNSGGAVVDADEYTWEMDADDSDLTDGDAIDAGNYTVTITASDGSGHFYGSTTGQFAIDSVKIFCVADADEQATYAYPTAISYDGTVSAYDDGWYDDEADAYTWHSTSLYPDDDPVVTFQYTGKSIRPTVKSVTYLGRELTAGVDYNVIYGGSLITGLTETAGTENLGESGSVTAGYVTVRYVTGGNFQNQESMCFAIDGTVESQLDIADATVSGTGDITYEDGETYEPITVSYGGSALTEGTDYEIAYEGNDAVGTATYTITGIGLYTGTKTGTFNLVEGSAIDIQYEYDAEALTATVTGVVYNGSADGFALTIPETVEYSGETYTVTAVADNACGGNVNSCYSGDTGAAKLLIESVSIPQTVTSIGSYAFGGKPNSSAFYMKQLNRVTFRGDSQLETIGKGAFYCTGITEVEIPAQVTSIGDLAFANTGLTKVTFLTTDAAGPAMSYGSNKSTFNDDTQLEIDCYAEAAAVQEYWSNFTEQYPSYQWTLNTYALVTFESNGATSVDSQDVWIATTGTGTPACTAAEPADPTRTGYTFGGWYTDAACTEPFDFGTELTGSITLYAKWMPSGSTISAGTTITAGSGAAAATYKVTGSNTATYVAPSSKGRKSLTVPATVKAGGTTYKVTAIADNAFKGSKATSITVQKNVAKIKAKTFAGAKKVKTITLGSGVAKIAAKSFKTNAKLTRIIVKTKKLTKKASVKNSLKGSKVKTIKVNVGGKAQNKKYVAKYKNTLGKKSVSGKTVTVKR